jgi:hypothetical protein
MSDEFINVDEIEAALERERTRWVDSPAEVFSALAHFFDAMLLEGAPGAIAASGRVQNLEVRPSPGLVDIIAWVKSIPLNTASSGDQTYIS